MGRKNRNAIRGNPRRFWNLPRNTHLLYSTDELYRDPIVVRYLGEQNDVDSTVKVFHPDGFEMWVHVSHLCRPPRAA